MKSGKISRPKKNLYLALSLLCLLLLIPIQQALGQSADPSPANSQGMELVEQIGGLVTDTVLLPDGSLLFSEGSSLVQARPTGDTFEVLARIDFEHGTILELVEALPWIYALTPEGLVVLSAENGKPTWKNYVPGGGQSIDVHDNRIAIAAREVGVRLLQIESSGRVRLLATVGVTGTAYDIAFSPDGRQVYSAGGQQGLTVIDVADDLSQSAVSHTIPDIAPAYTLTLSGSLLAVEGEGRLQVVDFSSGNAVVVGEYTPLKSGQRIVIEGEYAYIADSGSGLKIMWMTAPDRPVQVFGETDTPAFDVAIVDDLAYVAGVEGLRILDVSSHYRPREIGQIALPGQPQGIALATEQRIVVALGDQGVAVIDVSNSAAPRLNRRIPLDGPAHDVFFGHRGYVYVAAGEAGLAVIDVTQPGNEVLDGSLALPGEAFDIDQHGQILYVAAGDAGLLAVDTTFPDAPVLAGALAPEVGQAFRTVTIDGKRAYLAGDEAFTIADISYATRIGRLTKVAIPAEQIAISDVYLYALSDNQLAIYDVRATAEPVYLRTYSGLESAASIAAEGNTIFLTNQGDGAELVVLSLVAPDYPVETDNVGELGYTYHVLAQADQVWLARGYAGLQGYRLTEGGVLWAEGTYHALADVTDLEVNGGRLLASGQQGWAISEDTMITEVMITSVIRGMPVRDLAANGDLVAIAAGEEGIALFALTSSGEPSLVAQGRTISPVTGIALDQNFVYATDAEGLTIYDQRYLAPLTRITTPAPANGIALRGDLAYLALGDGSLAVLDLKQPDGGIVSRAAINTRYPAKLIPTPDGNTIYALAGDTLLQLSVAPPDQIQVLAEGTLPHVMGDGFFLNEVLVTITPGQAIDFLNVQFLGTYVTSLGDIPTTGQAVVVKEWAGYVAYGAGGLGLIDVRSPDEGQVFFDQDVRALYLEGNTLFAVGTALTAWDVSQLAAPQLIAELPLTAPGRSLTMGDSGLLLVSLENGLSIVEWDGAALTSRGHLTTRGAVNQAVQVGSRAYLGLHSGSLMAVDLSDPGSPTYLFGFTTESGQYVQDMLPLGDQHLMVSWENGIDLIDVSASTASPRVLTVIPAAADTAVDVTLSEDESMLALALGEAGVLLMGLDDPANPVEFGLATTPGNGLKAAILEDSLFIADGVCGLRVMDLSHPEGPRETGYWHGSYTADLAIGMTAENTQQPVIYLADANRLVMLRYDSSASPILPPLPQIPIPSHNQGDVSLSPTLKWGPTADPCDSFQYDVYLGVADNPPFVGQVMGESALEVGPLEPSRTYYWRVVTTDRQGDQIQGPLWTFTTAAADFADTLPPAPPLFIERLKQNPAVPLALAAFLITVILIGVGYWFRRQSRHPEDDIPDWYTTDPDTE